MNAIAHDGEVLIVYGQGWIGGEDLLPEQAENRD
jgi:hypothetical protein